MRSAPGWARFMLFFLCVGAFLFCTCSVWAQDNELQMDADTQKAIKQFVSSSGNFKNLAKATKFMVPTFNVEYTYQRYSARVGEESKTGNITKTALTDSYQTLELDEETYKRLTDALYDSFVSAMAQYTGLEAIAREVMTAEPVYQEISGKEKDDTKSHFLSARRGGNVKTGDKGAETVTYAPSGMVVQGISAAFQGSKFNDVAGKLGADAIMAVTLYVDFDKKTDTFFIKTADVKISDDLRKREKMIPFKGPVPGEFIYEFFAMQDLGLKKPLSTEVKVTDRRTGFFEQVSGTYSIDTNAAASSILEAYNTVAAMQAMEAARKMK